MSVEIWKFATGIADLDTFTQELVIDMPVEPNILSVGVQDMQLCIWAAVRTDDYPTQPRVFRIAMTGQDPKLPVATGWHFLGTVQFRTAPPFVIHVWDLGQFVKPGESTKEVSNVPTGN